MFCNRGHRLLFQQQNVPEMNQWQLKPLTSWLMPSFSQHNLRLIVLGRLRVSVTKFQDKFASLRQVNSHYS